MSDCDHHWIFVRDWYGNPDVINGTADCSFFRCTRCGDEQAEQPEDYLEPEPPERALRDWLNQVLPEEKP